MAKATPAKTAPAPVAAVEKEEESAGRPRGPKGVELTATIKLLVSENPKRVGSKSFDRFKAYKDGMTVEAALDAGIYTADLIYDSTHGFIKIAGYDVAVIEKKVKEPKPAKEAKGEVVKKPKAKEAEADEAALD
jgi:hypothetical protein